MLFCEAFVCEAFGSFIEFFCWDFLLDFFYWISFIGFLLLGFFYWVSWLDGHQSGWVRTIV